MHACILSPVVVSGLNLQPHIRYYTECELCTHTVLVTGGVPQCPLHSIAGQVPTTQQMLLFSTQLRLLSDGILGYPASPRPRVDLESYGAVWQYLSVSLAK